MADLYPLQVEINENNILKLQALYKRAHKEIEKEILTATDFGVYNRSVILNKIDAILQDVAIKTKGFIQEELPLYYEKGLKQATSQLNNIGAEVGTIGQFNVIHQEAIEALIDDTARAFGESLTGIARSANILLGKTLREEITFRIAKGFIAGEALREAKKAIKGVLRERGISSLVDKAGRNWTLDRYSEMLFRTKAVEARNRGLVNKMAEYNYDLVQVSQHYNTCDVCADWEGEILSITGETSGYPTLAQAEADGLFHPNCRHAVNVLIPSLARKTNAYETA